MIRHAIEKSDSVVIPYVTAGLPGLDETGDILKAIEGAPVIEIGLPFSDPMADGPVLQEASRRALEGGFTLDGFFERLPVWAAMTDSELVVMSYINPLMRRGLEETLELMMRSGISGVIIPDLPVDASDVFDYCSSIGLDLIRLVAPTTVPSRMYEVVSACSGFVYAVSVKGVTGARKDLPLEVKSRVESIREMTDLPVCVGFGVSTREQVEEVSRYADGVIVGSHLMKKLMDSGDLPGVCEREYAELTGRGSQRAIVM